MLEIIGGAILFIASVFIIVLVTCQDTQGGMSSAIGGASNSSYLGKNGGRTRDAMLSKATNIVAIVFFVVALAVNIIAVFVK